MRTHHLLGVSSLKIRCNSKNGDDKGTFPTIHKSFKWGSGVNTIFSVLTSMKKFISQTFKYTYERHHIITNKDACFSESYGKACRRNLCDKRHRSPGTGIFPASWCGGMTVNLWGTAGASFRHIQGGLSRRTQLVVQETQNLHGCVLHLTAGGLGRCGTLWLHQELEDAMGQWGRRDSKGVLVLRAELDMFSTRDDSAGRPWDDALVLHSVSFTLCCCVKPFSCSSFDSPWQWDLEKGTENVQKVSFFIAQSHLCLTRIIKYPELEVAHHVPETIVQTVPEHWWAWCQDHVHGEPVPAPRELLMITSTELLCSSCHPSVTAYAGSLVLSVPSPWNIQMCCRLRKNMCLVFCTFHAFEEKLFKYWICPTE